MSMLVGQGHIDQPSVGRYALGQTDNGLAEAQCASTICYSWTRASMLGSMMTNLSIYHPSNPLQFWSPAVHLRWCGMW